MKVLKFISFAMFAMMLAAGCNGVGSDDDPAEPSGNGSGLVVTVSPSRIVADGVDTAVIDVRCNGAAVDFKEVKFYNSADNSPLNWSSYNYTTTTAGTVTFFVTYKTYSTKDNPSTITAVEQEEEEKEEEPSGDGSGLVATVSPSRIVADGVDTAVIDVRYDGEAVDFEDVKFYNSADNSLLNWSSYNYTTTTAGTVTFFVTYKTYSTKDNPLTITAVEKEEEEEPEDKDPEEVKAFVRRSLIIDFTSVNCGYCPLVAAALNLFPTDEEYADRVVLAAVHCTGMGYDPFSLSNSSAFERYFSIGGYPYANVDFGPALEGAYATPEINKQFLAQYVEASQAYAAKAGIAATVELNNDKLTVYTTVKAAEKASLRIGGMLLENGLTALQENYAPGLTDVDTHNHVARIVDCQRTSSDFSGYDLGELKAGQSSEYKFEWKLDESWAKENCSIVLFVTAPDNSGKYTVTNAVHIDSLSGEYPFEYIEE